MNILIAYGTSEGQTRKIADYAATVMGESGHDVVLCDSTMVTRRLDVSMFDAIIIAGSVHQERHQESIIDFVIAHHDVLNSKPTAFISVSLSAVLELGKEDAQNYIDRFLTTTKWKPGRILPIGGALRYSEYDYFKQQIIKFIVIKGGGETSPGKDYEFTDWEVLTRFINDFLTFASDDRSASPSTA